MKLKYDNKEIIISKGIILFLYIVIVIISKFVRYTIMKTTLVDAARGDEILDDILYNSNLKFQFSSLDSSLAFNNAAVIFKFLNFFGLSTYLQFEIYISIIWNLFVVYMIINLDDYKSNIKSFYLILTIAVLNIFNFTLAKEPIQILYFFLIYICLNLNIRKNYKLILSIGIIIFSALTFRSYYILFAVFTCAVYYVLNILLKKIKKVKIIHILLIFSFLFIGIYSFMILSQKLMPKSYYDLLTVRTHSSNDAATKIKPMLAGSTTSPLFYSIEYIILLFRMLVPIELLLKGIKYIIFTIYQILISTFLIKGIKNYRSNTDLQNLALSIYLGFVLVSATFEPDFGSWIRHEASAFPVFILIIGLHRKGVIENVGKKSIKKI